MDTWWSCDLIDLLQVEVFSSSCNSRRRRRIWLIRYSLTTTMSEIWTCTCCVVVQAGEGVFWEGGWFDCVDVFLLMVTGDWKLYGKLVGVHFIFLRRKLTLKMCRRGIFSKSLYLATITPWRARTCCMQFVQTSSHRGRTVFFQATLLTLSGKLPGFCC